MCLWLNSHLPLQCHLPSAVASPLLPLTQHFTPTSLISHTLHCPTVSCGFGALCRPERSWGGRRCCWGAQSHPGWREPAGATQGGATASPKQLGAPVPWELKPIAKAQGSVEKLCNNLKFLNLSRWGEGEDQVCFYRNWTVHLLALWV